MDHSQCMSYHGDEPDYEGQEVEMERIIETTPKDISAIDIGWAKATQSVLRCLTQTPWECLEFLNIGKAQMGSIGCKYLSEGHWHFLKELKLNDNQIEKAGVVHLAKAYLPELEDLELNDNRIESGGVRAVSKIRCHKLVVLFMDRNRLPPQETKALFLFQWSLQYYSFQDNGQQRIANLKDLARIKFPLLEDFYFQ